MIILLNLDNQNEEQQQQPRESTVISEVSLRLVSMEQSQGETTQYTYDNLVDAGNLVYSYDYPFEQQNYVRQKLDSSEENYSAEQQPAEYNQENEYNHQSNSRRSRSINGPNHINKNWQYGSDSNEHDIEYDSIDKSGEYFQRKPTLKYAPENPLLSSFVGYHGQSIFNSKTFDAKTEAIKLIEEIAQDLKTPHEITNANTLSKFILLTKVLRTMNAEQIEDTTSALRAKYENSKTKVWYIYRDALVEAGTGI